MGSTSDETHTAQACQCDRGAVSNVLSPPATVKQTKKSSTKARKRVKSIRFEDLTLEGACELVDEVMQTKEIQKTVSKGHWSITEDLMLSDALKAFGGAPKEKGGWRAVAALVDGRTSKQCRERWCNHLATGIAPEAFDDEELRVVRWLCWLVKPSWSQVAELLNKWRKKMDRDGHRTDNAVKNVFNRKFRQLDSAGQEIHLSKCVANSVLQIIEAHDSDYHNKSALASLHRCASDKPVVAESVEVQPENETPVTVKSKNAEQQFEVSARSGLNFVAHTTRMDAYKKDRCKGLSVTSSELRPWPTRRMFTTNSSPNVPAQLVHATVIDKKTFSSKKRGSLPKAAAQEEPDDSAGYLLLQAVGENNLPLY